MSELALLSSAMSCHAMTELAYRNWDENNGVLSYQLLDPVTCDRYQKLPERTIENNLKYVDLTRKLCFTHDPAFKLGDYHKQIGDQREEDFEKWTRRKDIGKPYQPTSEEMLCDLDYEFFHYHNKKQKKNCILHDGNQVKRVRCPQTCGPHPLPCPNPIL